MRRFALLLLAMMMLAPAAEAFPLGLVRGLSKLGLSAGKMARFGKMAKLGKGLKGATSAGAAAKASQLAMGASRGALAADATRVFGLFRPTAGRTTLMVGGGESGALHVITRAGDQVVTSPMALSSALEDAVRVGGKPVDVLLDANAAMQVDVRRLPPDTQLFVILSDNNIRRVTVIDDGVGRARPVVTDNLGEVWDLAQFVMDVTLNAMEEWPVSDPFVIAVTGGPCAPALAEHAPKLDRCDATSVADWLQTQTGASVVLLVGEGDDPEGGVASFVSSAVTIARAQGHDLTALTLSTLHAESLAVASALASKKNKRHAPYLKVAPLSSSEFTPGSPAVLRGEFVPDSTALPNLLAGVWVVHPPEAGITSFADVPLWVYGLGLLLSLPLSMLLWEKGKLYSAGQGLKGAASAPDPR
ncbi:MAG: hypothetical protein IPI35_27230 [Deltaproteobacteria bacterium]|nr:hypothetical protein [Deltaproteobacteria bacterium]